MGFVAMGVPIRIVPATIDQLNAFPVSELMLYANYIGVRHAAHQTKAELVKRIMDSGRAMLSATLPLDTSK